MTTVPNDFSIYQSFTLEGLRLFLFEYKSQDSFSYLSLIILGTKPTVVQNDNFWLSKSGGTKVFLKAPCLTIYDFLI